MRIDLHTHTTASDGLLTPAELVRAAAAEPLDVIAVTDHDTVDGVAEASAASSVRVVPGIELSTTHEGASVHVLGLFLGTEHSGLRRALAAFGEERAKRAEEMVRRLNAIGYPITMYDVAREAGRAVIGRPHVARALIRLGLVPDMRSAFSRELLGDGGPADVPRSGPSSAEAIRLVRDAAGVAVLAHPGSGRRPLTEPEIEALLGAGASGIEVEHPDHSPETRDALRALTERLGAVATGGSDFHGDERGSRLGACTTSPEAFARLEAIALGRKRGR